MRGLLDWGAKAQQKPLPLLLGQRACNFFASKIAGAISTAIFFIYFSVSGSAFLTERSVYVGASLGKVRGAKAGGASGLR